MEVWFSPLGWRKKMGWREESEGSRNEIMYFFRYHLSFDSLFCQIYFMQLNSVSQCKVVRFIREGWQNCSKKFRRLFNGYLPTYGKKTKGQVCLCVYFSLFGLETHFITKFSYFWAFFFTFEADLRGLFML